MFGLTEIIGIILIILGIAFIYWRTYFAETYGFTNTIWIVIGILVILVGIFCLKDCMRSV